MKHRLLTLAMTLGATAVIAGTAQASDGSAQASQQTNKDNKQHYVVVSGDSLSSIADQYKLDSWRPLWNVNDKLDNPDVIHVGDDIVIPNGPTTDRPVPADAVIAQTPVAHSYSAPAQHPVARAAANYAGGASGIFARIRMRESGGNYATNTGNGYYGAYQFDLGTWGNFGGYARPDLAPPAVQDAKAAQVYAVRGCSPWPNTCY